MLNYKVTILLATSNRAHLIKDTLDSIIAQTHQNWNCIIVDDHSTDNTKEVVQNYIKNDSRFSYFKKKGPYKKGLSGTRNYGLDLARKKGAEFIQLFDDDDIMHPNKLELQLEPFQKNPTLDLTVCGYRKFHQIEMIEYDLEKADDQSCNIQTNDLLKSFFLGYLNLNSPGPLWRAEIFKSYRFNEDLKYGEERELYLRIFLNENLKYEPVNKILFWYRKHAVAITSNMNQDQKFKEEASELVRNEFLKEIIKQRKAPFYLLKSYVAHGVRKQKKEYVLAVRAYLYKRFYFINFKYLLLLISTKATFIWKVKKF